MSDVDTRSLRGCFQGTDGRKVSLGVVDKEIEIERFSSRWIGSADEERLWSCLFIVSVTVLTSDDVVTSLVRGK